MTSRSSLAPLVSALLLAGSALASAQPVAPGAAPESSPVVAAQQNTLKLQRIRSGFVFAPDVKIADIDHVTGTFVGGYGGWLTDDRFLVGAAGYWLVSPTDHRDISYFGAIVGWQVPVGDAFRFGARGLVGGGWATLADTYDYWVPDHPGGAATHADGRVARGRLGSRLGLLRPGLLHLRAAG